MILIKSDQNHNIVSKQDEPVDPEVWECGVERLLLDDGAPDIVLLRFILKQKNYEQIRENCLRELV